MNLRRNWQVDLKDKEFTFKLVDVTDSANPVDLGETTNDAKGKIVFSNLSLSKPGVYHYRVTEVPEMTKMWLRQTRS
ncbi:MAG: Spy0128 family protein [Streptococcus salivarius]